MNEQDFYAILLLLIEEQDRDKREKLTIKIADEYVRLKKIELTFLPS